MLSMNESMVRSLIGETLPSFQLVDIGTDNLGLGFLYYGIARALRPKNVVAIGSKKGFAPLCLALGLKDNEGYGIRHISCYQTEMVSNGVPALHFIDPSYSVERDDTGHMYGIDFWDDADRVIEWWKKFGVEAIVAHYKVRSEDYLSSDGSHKEIDLLLLDGDHDPQAILADLERFAPHLKQSGLILAHDVHPDFPMGGGRAFDAIDVKRWEKLLIPVFPGLGLFRLKEGAWTKPSVDFT